VKRRDFLALAGATAAFPCGVRGQTPQRQGRPWIIAFISNETEAQAEYSSLGPFRQGLNKLGYVEGRDFVIVTRFGRGDNNAITGLAREVVALAPDLIVPDTQAVLALVPLTASIPMLGYFGGSFTTTVLPLIVGSPARPGGNVTGIFTDSITLTGKHCDLALEVVPTATRIGVISEPFSTDRGKGTREVVGAAATAHKFIPVIAEVAQPAEVAAGFRALAEKGVEVAIVGSGFFSTDRMRTIEAAASVRLPTIYNEQGYVEAGGLISYGFSRAATFGRLASFAELLLKGTPVADIPVQETSAYFTAINLKTARSLGLPIPPTVQFRADQVIE
jgi:putative ABC transport system substrate-binding protein